MEGLENVMNDKDYWYHCGVMDAFCEIVAAGVKKLALSHPINSKEDLNSLLPYAKQLCRQYGIQYYEERELLITDLFPFRLNKGHYNILFFREAATLQAYLALKKRKEDALRLGIYEQQRTKLALDFGELLSYDLESCLKKLEENTEKEKF